MDGGTGANACGKHFGVLQYEPDKSKISGGHRHTPLLKQDETRQQGHGNKGGWEMGFMKWWWRKGGSMRWGIRAGYEVWGMRYEVWGMGYEVWGMGNQ